MPQETDGFDRAGVDSSEVRDAMAAGASGNSRDREAEEAAPPADGRENNESASRTEPLARRFKGDGEK